MQGPNYIPSACAQVLHQINAIPPLYPAISYTGDTGLNAIVIAVYCESFVSVTALKKPVRSYYFSKHRLAKINVVFSQQVHLPPPTITPLLLSYNLL